MFPPMRPEPDHAELHRRHLEEVGEGDAAGTDAAGLEGAQVAGGLGLLEVTEAEGLAGDRRSRAGRRRRPARTRWLGRSALVELAGGVEEPRAEPEARGDAVAVTQRDARGLEARHRRAHRDRRRPGGRGGRPARSWARRSRERLRGDVGSAFGEHLGGGGLGGGDVGLVEGLDADGGAGEGDRQLHRHGHVADAVGARVGPADDGRVARRLELVDGQLREEEAIVAVDRRRAERLAHDRHGAGAVLAERLGDELLHPEAHGRERRIEEVGDLVAARCARRRRSRSRAASAGFSSGVDVGRAVGERVEAARAGAPPRRRP